MVRSLDEEVALLLLLAISRLEGIVRSDTLVSEISADELLGSGDAMTDLISSSVRMLEASEVVICVMEDCKVAVPIITEGGGKVLSPTSALKVLIWTLLGVEVGCRETELRLEEPGNVKEASAADSEARLLISTTELLSRTN
jgi:hypothetical protein